MANKLKDFAQKNPKAWEFAKYTGFSLSAGLFEVALFSLLNYILPSKGINKPVDWFVFVYPTAAGGLGAMIAFVVSAIVGQSLKFVTNFTKTFKSTNNMLASAIGFAVMAVIIVIGLNMYLGGILAAALCKIIPNADIAGAIAKAICQVTGFLLSFPVNKYVLMRNKSNTSTTKTNTAA